MVLINKAINEVTVKLVYYGPGLCGKTTNLEKIYSNPKLENKGKMISMSTETDRTLFFDFMPMELGTIAGQKVRVQLYTVPGQVFYDATRKLDNLKNNVDTTLADAPELGAPDMSAKAGVTSMSAGTPKLSMKTATTTPTPPAPATPPPAPIPPPAPAQPMTAAVFESAFS